MLDVIMRSLTVVALALGLCSARAHAQSPLPGQGNDLVVAARQPARASDELARITARQLELKEIARPKHYGLKWALCGTAMGVGVFTVLGGVSLVYGANEPGEERPGLIVTGLGLASIGIGAVAFIVLAVRKSRMRAPYAAEIENLNREKRYWQDQQRERRQGRRLEEPGLRIGWLPGGASLTFGRRF